MSESLGQGGTTWTHVGCCRRGWGCLVSRCISWGWRCGGRRLGAQGTEVKHGPCETDTHRQCTVRVKGGKRFENSHGIFCVCVPCCQHSPRDHGGGNDSARESRHSVRCCTSVDGQWPDGCSPPQRRNVRARQRVAAPGAGRRAQDHQATNQTTLHHVGAVCRHVFDSLHGTSPATLAFAAQMIRSTYSDNSAPDDSIHCITCAVNPWRMPVSS